MEFRFSAEQLMIRDTVATFLRSASSPMAVRQAITLAGGQDPLLWQRLCSELCLSAVTIPQQYGGLGLSYVELAIVLEQAGRRLLCAPLLATQGLAVNALLLMASQQQKARLLPAIAAGKMTAALAWVDRTAAHGGGRWDSTAVSACWQKTPQGYRLDGEFCYVIDGASADWLVVACRRPGSVGNAGIALFVIAANTPGVTRHWTPSLDQTRRLANITLCDVQVGDSQLLGSAGTACQQLDQVLSLGKCALAAEQLGVMRQSLEIAVDYTQERQQFGRVIAGYQAIKHKAADMLLKAEVACSAVYYAACVASETLAADGDALIAAELHEAAAMAKGYCSDAVFFNAGSALQLFGGVGFSAEYDIQLYFKRAKACELYLGNGAYQRDYLAALLLDETPVAAGLAVTAGLRDRECRT